jgi:hypothetical protein
MTELYDEIMGGLLHSELDETTRELLFPELKCIKIFREPPSRCCSNKHANGIVVPSDVWIKIITHLGLNDLCSLGQVCHGFRYIFKKFKLSLELEDTTSSCLKDKEPQLASTCYIEGKIMYCYSSFADLSLEAPFDLDMALHRKLRLIHHTFRVRCLKLKKIILCDALSWESFTSLREVELDGILTAGTQHYFPENIEACTLYCSLRNNPKLDPVALESHVHIYFESESLHL